MLNSALERDRAPELCDNLSRLYDYAQHCLQEASTAMDPSPIAHATAIVERIRAAFAEAALAT